MEKEPKHATKAIQESLLLHTVTFQEIPDKDLTVKKRNANLVASVDGCKHCNDVGDSNTGASH